MEINSRDTLTELGHKAFVGYGTGYLEMIKTHVFTETNVGYYAVACIFILALLWLGSFLFQDKDD